MKYMTGFGTLSKQEVDQLGRDFNIELPNDYREFLIQNNGGLPTQNYLMFSVPDLDDNNNELILGSLCGMLGAVNKWNDIYAFNDEYRDDMMKFVMVIGHEYADGHVVLINRPDMSGVYYWDSAYMFDCSSEEDTFYAYKLCDTFTEFMDMLVFEP